MSLCSLLLNKLTLCMLGNFSCFCRLLAYFKINFFKKIFREYNQCQTVWIQIRTDALSVLIWGQTVCKGYQQTAKMTSSMVRGHFTVLLLNKLIITKLSTFFSIQHDHICFSYKATKMFSRRHLQILLLLYITLCILETA